MTVRDLRKILCERGCIEVRQVGSHLTVSCGKCVTTVAVHTGDVPTGTLRKIERDIEPCLRNRMGIREVGKVAGV